MWDLRGRLGYMGFEVKGAVLGERESITASYEFRRFLLNTEVPGTFRTYTYMPTRRRPAILSPHLASSPGPKGTLIRRRG